MCIEHDDTLHPELGTLIENRRSWGLDNPDTNYGFCRLDPDATYVLRGDRGTACALELQVATGHFADGDFAGWQARSRLSGDDLPASVEVTLSPEPPAHGGAWLRTGPGASYLHVRQYFGDWATERPARFTIERIGAPYPPPPLSRGVMDQRLDLLHQWLTVGAACWWDLGRSLAEGEPGDIAPFLPPDTATGLGGQAYGMGAYRCGPDDAVILELDPPRCRYWSVSLATWYWESADTANRQCSLNHTQAVPDPDGTYRFVISPTDPGVANWLDPAGYERGTLAVRYLHADARPVLRYRPAQPGEVEGLESPRVSAAERTAVLRARRDALVARS